MQQIQFLTCPALLLSAEKEKLDARKRQRERQRCGVNGGYKPGLAQQQQKAGPSSSSAAAAGPGAAARGQDLGSQHKRLRLNGGLHAQAGLQEVSNALCSYA